MSSSPLVKNFKPDVKEHVEWLKTLFGILDIMKLNPDDIIKQERSIKHYDMETIIKENPMGITISTKDLMEFPVIHFSLAMAYSDAVLKKQAWIPR